MPIPTNEEVGVNGLPLGTQTVTEIFDAAESGEEEGEDDVEGEEGEDGEE